MGSVFDVAKKGFGEGTNELYDRARPSYPSSILNHLYNSIPSSAHARRLRIIEPGSGTGIFTRLLVAPPVEGGYPTWNISNLVSVEPSSGMRNQWQRSLDKLGPQVVQGKEVRAVAGGFDEFGEVKQTIGEGEADLIVVAQAYHWCPDHEAAFRNFAKYLAPEGVLAFVWNLESRTHPLSSAVLQMLPEYDQGSPQYYKMWWRKCFDTEAYKEEFDATKTEEKTVEWKTPMTDESTTAIERLYRMNVPATTSSYPKYLKAELQYQDRIMSKSYLTEELLNGERRKVFLQKFHDILVKHAADKEFVDEQKGIYNVSYTTDIVLLRKKT